MGKFGQQHVALEQRQRCKAHVLSCSLLSTSSPAALCRQARAVHQPYLQAVGHSALPTNAHQIC